MSGNTWVPEHLPPSWVAPRIMDLCDVVRGGSPRPMGDPRYFGGTIPFIKIADVTRSNGTTVYEAETMVTAEGALRSRQLSAGRLILTNSATVCVPIFLGVDACIHDGFVAFEGLPNFVCQKFLYYFFKYIRRSYLTNTNRA
jgi:type I restriction enzyme S subunit